MERFMTQGRLPVTLVSFAGDRDSDDDGWRQRQRLLHRTAMEHGEITGARLWCWEDIRGSGFYQRHRALLDASRGCGYWLWKPYILLRSLDRVAAGEYVLYHDIGRAFREGDAARGGSRAIGNVIELPVYPVIQWAEDNDGMFPGVNIPHYGPASKWTKRDCFVGMGCDSAEYWKLPLVQAGYNAWKNTPAVREFLETWLALCCRPELISDDANVLGRENLEGFSEHRHDQSILSNLLRQRQVNVFGSLTSSKAYVRNFNYIIRRCALDAMETSQRDTLTAALGRAGGAWNLPVSVTTWIDLDNAVSRRERRRCLLVRDRANAEESILRNAMADAHWETEDWRRHHRDECVMEEGATDEPVTDKGFDWVFAYGFRDQSKLLSAIRRFVPGLKPGGFMIAGLDHSEAHSPETTFADGIRAMAATRRLDSLDDGAVDAAPDLVVGMASNPVTLKQRGGRPLVVSIQRGLPGDIPVRTQRA